ncbi:MULTISPECIES: hypothetical protein [unclassified Anabaena]|uniref:hypothetical protein n=1 Tax=unclassified Anabaena TaxID=2619674 RepID=UPI000A611351|nr:MULTISPECIES: hypothetical protein [unclassified Anabaena]
MDVGFNFISFFPIVNHKSAILLQKVELAYGKMDKGVEGVEETEEAEEKNFYLVNSQQL